ncbi:DUF6578 domain-containing protein [Cellulomonas sp. B6]|uniref:DUF6578 domain-containing protein n=1 Tax=Cellulomonas sp. B6 TaxID=1295626 RepID=UPI00073C1B75|nr:DUF6578 domain-containing protein [Cellulomonas sp. B6]KSW14090.1 hypothetical protein ATM99_02800 [Cellulomonas sp. B6]
MSVRVWVAAWQLQCCGEVVRPGSVVEWQCGEPDHDWLANAVGPDVAAGITHAEEHHGDPSDTGATVRGTVTGLDAAFCRFGPTEAGGSVLHPVRGSGSLRPVTTATGREQDAPGTSLIGYVVDLAPQAPTP